MFRFMIIFASCFPIDEDHIQNIFQNARSISLPIGLLSYTKKALQIWTSEPSHDTLSDGESSSRRTYESHIQAVAEPGDREKRKPNEACNNPDVVSSQVVQLQSSKPDCDNPAWGSREKWTSLPDFTVPRNRNPTRPEEDRWRHCSLDTMDPGPIGIRGLRKLKTLINCRVFGLIRPNSSYPRGSSLISGGIWCMEHSAAGGIELVLDFWVRWGCCWPTVGN